MASSKEGKAANELAQLNAEDASGVVVAKVRQQAAIRKQEKITQSAAVARADAARKRKPFVEKREEAERAEAAAKEVRLS